MRTTFVRLRLDSIAIAGCLPTEERKPDFSIVKYLTKSAGWFPWFTGGSSDFVDVAAEWDGWPHQ